MFSDYFFESMILLKHSFCWDWIDVLYFVTNQRANRKECSTYGLTHKVGCVFPIAVVSILPHAEFGSNDRQENAPHFTYVTKAMLHRLCTKRGPVERIQ